MELITVKASKNLLTETEFYSDLYNDMGSGFIMETCLYKKEKGHKLVSFTVGCYFIKIKVKKEVPSRYNIRKRQIIFVKNQK